MFALGIHYLNGWAMAAADGMKKEQAEWPPHPGRVFMALTAAWFETGEDAAEGEALRWLEALPPPEVVASGWAERSSVVSHVPVNDDSSPVNKKGRNEKPHGEGSLPIGRNRQPRSFPVAIPHDPKMYLVWPEADLGPHRVDLEGLAAKVTHVGHSASLVQAWVEDGEAVIRALEDLHHRWEPTDGVAERHLRVHSIGRLVELARVYNRDEVLEYAELKAQSDALKGAKSAKMRREKRQLDDTISERFPRVPVSQHPGPGRWQGYKRHQEEHDTETPGSVFDPNLVVLVIRDRRVPLTTTLNLTQALRGALMDSCTVQPPPEWFSGHRPDGLPSTEPHLALLPLPFTGDMHADGRVMGVALALPSSLEDREAARCLDKFLYEQDTGMPRRHKLFDGRWFECGIELETSERPPKNLDARTWTRESRVWASVTPVVLDRHFNGKDKWMKAAEGVKDAFKHVGLPRPSEVLLHPVSLVEGAPHSREFPRLTRKRDGGQMRHSHAVVVFEAPVRGPVLVGAGRYRGYGLFRPMDGQGS